MQKLVYAVVALLLVLIVVGFALPRKHQVEATIEIEAHPATVFALVNDFRRQSEWSPWAKSDPNARIVYSGSPRGEGAIMAWNGTVLGSGSQIITTSRPYEHVAITMNPGEDGEAYSWFDLRPGVATTQVTWGFEADYGMNIVGRFFATALGSVIVSDYRNGLESLKSMAESLPSADFSNLEVERIVVEAETIAFLPSTSRPEPAAVSSTLARAYFEILRFIDDHGLTDAGAPISITKRFSGAELAFDAAIPVRGATDRIARDAPGVKIGSTYAGPVLRIKHVGSYRNLAETHRRVSAYLAAVGIERNGPSWESYVSDPGNTPESDLLTYIYYPIRVD